MFRLSHLVLGALALTVDGCNSSVTNFVFTPSITSAGVRFVNDTDSPVVVSSTGVLGSTSTKLGFGQASACLLVSLPTSAPPTLSVTNAVTGATTTFSPELTTGANVTVVTFGDAAGNLHFATLDNTFAPAANSAGLRFFNGASTAALFMQRSGVAPTASIGHGAASNFVSVPTDSASITFSKGSSIVLDAGQMAFRMGQSSTVFLGPPAAETSALRFFIAQGC
jgi:hypothetical protein